MNTIGKNIEGVFTQNKIQLYFFLGIGIAFSLLVLWMFLFRQDIPEKLMQMTLAVWGMLWAGIAKGINKIETLLNRDLNGDGVIGGDVDSTNPINIVPDVVNNTTANNINTVTETQNTISPTLSTSIPTGTSENNYV